VRVARYQIIQTAPARLRVRLEIEPSYVGEATEIWESAEHRLRDMLEKHGLSHVEIERAVEPPQINPATGKYRRVWREYQ
jgi:phenylacetate-CoA ligase